MNDQQSKDLAYIKYWEDELAHMRKRYLARMDEKAFDLADQINGIIKLYEQELSNARNDYARDYPSQVSSAHHSADKRIFVIEK